MRHCGVYYGRRPSHLWQRVREELRPYGLTPQEYIREMRADGCSWADIGRSLADDCGLEAAPQAGTLSFWERVVPYEHESVMNGA